MTTTWKVGDRVWRRPGPGPIPAMARGTVTEVSSSRLVVRFDRYHYWAFETGCKDFASRPDCLGHVYKQETP